MKIEGKGPAATPAERIQAIQSREAPAGKQNAPPSNPSRSSDRVEISAEGRALAGAEAAGVESVGPRPVPVDDPNRIDHVRERVRSGFYMSDEVQAAVARAIVARGDHQS